ncbi:WD40-repeat-containing domain protein [Staphylotrichum tortipilum]|uniref:WD40-repeat-containing domain protein n=1 Tax=Staphylotrichum tortipilum TaxID=2831512 RepID=A0AAN6RPQ9_9PEZI|nr:WD40-repeat-containing domain protein [Staphylotrichum longicolle]
MAPLDSAEWDLPRLRASFIFQDDYKYLSSDDQLASQDLAEFFDVKFYPYNPPGAPPIFAATSKKHAVVCRLSQTTDKDTNPCEIIQLIRDDGDDANCASCWSRDPVTQEAWLCIAGNDSNVKVYNVNQGKLVKTLTGHGGGINDLATSPQNPLVIASASDDTSIRIWSLDAAHEKQPCVCILGGESHSYDLLSVAFHDNGRYILSSGHDQVINLWALPEFPTEHVAVPIVIHYPHFSSSEIHNNLVDCVAFHGDLILSRACHEDCIVLWQIEGFSSADPIPSPHSAPTPTDMARQTRSAFAPATLSLARPALFTRLAQFHTPDCGVQFFMRFRVFHAPGRHPILAFANARSRTFFWDLARFGAYRAFMGELKDGQKGKASVAANGAAAGESGGPVKPSWLVVKRGKKPPMGTAAAVAHSQAAVGDGASSLRSFGLDGGSMVSASPDPEGGNNATTADLGYSRETLQAWAEMYDLSNPVGYVKPHRTLQIDGGFVGRQVGWSPEGDWCVVVGNGNRALIYQRWGKGAVRDA